MSHHQNNEGRELFDRDQKARAILQVIAEKEPRGSLRFSGGYESDPGIDITYGCIFCGAEEEASGKIRHWTVDYDEDENGLAEMNGCPWVAARKLLGLP